MAQARKTKRTAKRKPRQKGARKRGETAAKAAREAEATRKRLEADLADAERKLEKARAQLEGTAGYDTGTLEAKCRATAEDLESLDELIRGYWQDDRGRRKPIRNAATRLAALREKLNRGHGLPRQTPRVAGDEPDQVVRYEVVVIEE